MALIGFLLFIVNLLAVAWSFVMVADSIKHAGNPLVYLILTIGFVVSIAWLGQFIARQPEDGAPTHVSH